MVSHGHQEPTATPQRCLQGQHNVATVLLLHIRGSGPHHIRPALPNPKGSSSIFLPGGSGGNQKATCAPLTGFCPSKDSPAFAQPSHHLICYLSLFLPSKWKLNLTKMLSIFSSPYFLAFSKPSSVSLRLYCSLKNHFLQPFFLILLILPNTLLLNYTNIFIQ